MDSEIIADLKQFISAELYQQTASLKKEIVTEVRKEIVPEIRKEIEDSRDQILEAIGDTMTTRDSIVDEQLADHDRRLTWLEHKAA